MKDWVKIGLLAAGVFLIFKKSRWNPTGLMSPEDIKNNDLAQKDIVSFGYRKLDDGWYLKILFHDGTHMEGKETDEESFNLYMRDAQQAGAEIKEF